MFYPAVTLKSREKNQFFFGNFEEGGGEND